MGRGGEGDSEKKSSGRVSITSAGLEFVNAGAFDDNLKRPIVRRSLTLPRAAAEFISFLILFLFLLDNSPNALTQERRRDLAFSGRCQAGKM